MRSRHHFSFYSCEAAELNFPGIDFSFKNSFIESVADFLNCFLDVTFLRSIVPYYAASEEIATTLFGLLQASGENVHPFSHLFHFFFLFPYSPVVESSLPGEANVLVVSDRKDV